MSYKKESSSCDAPDCDYKRSKLFCSTGNEGKVTLTLPGVIPKKTTIASLEVCQEKYSEVLHDVCGVFSVVLGPDTESLFFNLTFRIIDEFGKEICRRTFHIIRSVEGIPDNLTSVTIDFPFCLNCCDTSIQCETNTTYRLQVSGEAGSSEQLSHLIVLRDVTWAAIVWEACFDV